MSAAVRDLDLRPQRERGAFPSGLPNTGFFKRPRLPAGVRFALCMDRLLGVHERNPFAVKPWAFASAAELAKSLHRRRAGRELQLLDVSLSIEPRRHPDTPVLGVSVWATDAGGRREFLGWAYVDGQGRHALAYTLQRNPLSWERRR